MKGCDVQVVDPDAAIEISEGRRFPFGANWHRFLSTLDKDRIKAAENELADLISVKSMRNQTFLDAGSGSGLSSLAAVNLGAKVTSFDYDSESVLCTNLLRQEFADDDSNWIVTQGSLLDADFMAGLETYDWVYCWGVAHHTGNQRLAIELLKSRVNVGGGFAIALYNDQGWKSSLWRFEKRIYSAAGERTKRLLENTAACYFIHLRNLVRKLRSMSLNSPRGMDLRADLRDWIGGYPFEVASVEAVLSWFPQQEWIVERVKPVGNRNGCNEFVFRRNK